MSITTVDQNVIHYEVLGRGKPLIFVHGWLGSWRYWWPSMQELSRDNRAFAFDFWGFGNSSKVPSKYSFDAYVAMIDQLLERLGIFQPVTLVGHSMGAAVALRFAMQNPDRVERLACISMPVNGSLINSRLTSSDSTSFVNRVVGKGNSYPEVDGELAKCDSAAMNVLASQLQQVDFSADLAATPCPTMLVYGDQDPVIQFPNGALPELDAAKNRYLVSLEGGNHFPMLQQTETFNRLLIDFLRSDNSVTEIAPKSLWKRRTR